MDDLKVLLKTTSKYISILDKGNIKTVKDFLEYFPKTYEDRSSIKTLSEISGDSFFKDNNKVMTKGKILSKKIFMRGRKKVYDISFEDINGKRGYISIFNSGFLAQKIQEDKWYLILGKPSIKFGKIVFSHPDVIETQYEKDSDLDDGYFTGRLFPIYSELLGIKSGWFAKKNRLLMDKVDIFFKEYLPDEFIKKFNLMGVVDTIKQIHFPDNMELNKEAFNRVFFDRLLRIQLYSMLNKNDYVSGFDYLNVGNPIRNEIKLIISKLPFKLTNSQKKVIKDLIEDFHSNKPMMRLLQGDVGSGKTVVAAIAAYYIYKIIGGQSVFLAPLEVLANQHYRTLAKLFLPLGLNVSLLTGAMTKGEKDKIKSDLKQGKINVIVGTHALLQEDVEFKNLKYAVIDEQHKFGVKQRAVLKNFGSPHILQMSATPIPRSMALAFFGEFDVSIIDEMPVGRKPIFTKIISEKEYFNLKLWILSKINEGQKVFIVTPLIEESEKMENLKSAVIQFQEVNDLFPELNGKIGLLHGKMKSQEKDKIMNDFKNGKICLLVSTTVIEVGVDIPDATIMIIKNAERFGLSQLHQLRGRIGRSDLKSYCFLETKNKSGDSYKRLKVMEDVLDGFKLAEIDLQNRGAGEILGTMQSGEADIPLNFLSDLKFIERVQDGAKWLLQKYPKLEGLDLLKNYLKEKIGDVLV